VTEEAIRLAVEIVEILIRDGVLLEGEGGVLQIVDADKFCALPTHIQEFVMEATSLGEQTEH
jgi:hypothetical protein